MGFSNVYNPEAENLFVGTVGNGGSSVVRVNCKSVTVKVKANCLGSRRVLVGNAECIYCYDVLLENKSFTVSKLDGIIPNIEESSAQV